MWTAYLVVIHLLAIPGAYILLASGLTLFLASTTSVLTGETLPWARGMGWAAIGAALIGGCWILVEVLN